MSNNRQAKKILKIFAKEMIDSRVKYADSFLEEKPPMYQTISYKFMVKRCLVVALILILSFAILVVAANGVGIKILNLDIFETSTHTEMTPRNENSIGRYYNPTYIPEDYTLVNIDDDFAMDYVYVNDKDEALYILESYSSGASYSVDNEDCKRSIELIGECETHIYEYTDGTSVFVFEKGTTYITIQSSLEKNEVIKIIQGLKVI